MERRKYGLFLSLSSRNKKIGIQLKSSKRLRHDFLEIILQSAIHVFFFKKDRENENPDINPQSPFVQAAF